MQYVIRKAEAKDLDNIIDLATNLVWCSTSPFRNVDPEKVKFYRREDLVAMKQHVTSSLMGIFVAETLEGKFLGHVISMVGNEESSTGEVQGYVFDLSIIEECQGLGIGKKLMETAEEFCRKGGMKYVCLNVTTSNEKAVKFYERIGYSEERKRMIKALPPSARTIADIMKEIDKKPDVQTCIPMTKKDYSQP
jgi:ribosomal protein S18 acetylase RimI-like enzyme